MMLSTLTYALFICFVSALLAKPLHAVDDQTLESDLGDLRPDSHSSIMLSSSNTSLSSVNVSRSNDGSINCDGEKYGFNPDIADCTSALGHQLVGQAQVKFGQRGRASARRFVHLPYRLMGGMLWPLKTTVSRLLQLLR